MRQGFYSDKGYKSNIQTFITSPGTIVNGRQDLCCLPRDSVSTEWDPDRLIVLNIMTPHLKYKRLRKKASWCDKNVLENQLLNKMFTCCS